MSFFMKRLCIILALSLLLARPSYSSENSTRIEISADGDGSEGVKTLRRAIERQGETKIPIHIVLQGRFVIERAIRVDSRNDGVSISADKDAELIAAGGAMRGIEIIRSSGTRVTGLRLSGFSHDGIYVEDSNDVIIERNTVTETQSSGWSQGAIHLTGNVAGSLVSDNIVQGADYGGIHIDTKNISDVSNVRIIGNYVSNTCRRIFDCGAIYINDRSKRSRNIMISNNVVKNFGPPEVGGRGIYLDDWASFVTVTDNNISGPGRYAFQIHGGNNNQIERNIVNMRGIGTALLYQEVKIGDRPLMTGNTLKYNTFNESGALLFTPRDISGTGSVGLLQNRRCRQSGCVPIN